MSRDKDKGWSDKIIIGSNDIKIEWDKIIKWLEWEK
jgi:hypothetical protein